jgi:site-specific recombinase XerD
MNRNPKQLTLLPSQQLLQQIWAHLISRPKKRGEYKKDLQECLYLLCWKVGLRVSEAIGFDLSLEHQQSEYKNLYLCRGKRQKERWVYVRSEIVRELRQRKWQPHQTKRSSFFSFLQQIKQELSLARNIELAPHTLRRCFATHNAIAGMPLPVLQKVLGHSKISTTALYIRDSDLSNLVKYKPI